MLQNIRDSGDANLAQIVSLIRSNASLDEIHRCLTRLTSEDPEKRREITPILEQLRADTEAQVVLQNQQSSPQQRGVFGIQRLTTTPPYIVPARPWTSVTDDDELVSHLVSLWAMWCNPFPDGIVLEYFIRDMKFGQLSSRFCSPFLVNSILGVGCLYSDYEETRTRGGLQSSLANAFLREAKQHLDNDQAKSSLTNMQGLSVLYLLFNQIGQDRQGFNYASQALAMCEEMSRSRPRGEMLQSVRSEKEAEEIVQIIDTALWGITGAVTCSYLSWMRPQTMDLPNVPVPETLGLAQSEAAWAPYPRHGGDSQHLFMHEARRAHANLAIVTREVTTVLFNRHDPELSIDDLRKLDSKLVAGHDGISEQTIGSPAVVYLRLWWFSVITTVLRAQLSLLGPQDQPAIWSRLLSIALESVELLDTPPLHRDKDKINVWMCHPIYQACFILLEANHDNRHDKEIAELCITLRAMSRRIPTAVALLRMIQLDAKRCGLNLPGATNQLFQDFELNDVKELQKRSKAHDSIYPNMAAAWLGNPASDNGHIMYMGEFLDKYDPLPMDVDP